MPASDQEPTSKGFTLLGALAFVDEHHGADGRQRLLAGLDEEMGRVLSGTILSHTWYPFRYQVGLYRAIDATFGAGDLAMCREIGRFTADREAGTVHRLLMKLASLERWLSIAGHMWRFYYSQGSLETHVASGSGTVEISDFDPLDRAFCLDFAGWLERTVELCGKRDVRVEHSRCTQLSASTCVYDVSWT